MYILCKLSFLLVLSRLCVRLGRRPLLLLEVTALAAVEDFLAVFAAGGVPPAASGRSGRGGRGGRVRLVMPRFLAYTSLDQKYCLR